MTDWVLLDFETSSAVDLKKAGAWRYAEDPTTEVLCLSYSFNGTGPDMWVPGEPMPTNLQAAIEAPTVFFVAHNAAFEKAIWRHILVQVFGWPDVPNSRWHDTMAACAYKALPLALEDAAGVLHLPHQKDLDGSRAVRELSKFAKNGYVKDRDIKLARAKTYCADDVRAEVDLHARVGWLPAGERNVWLLDQRINERGVKLDMEYVDACAEVVEKATTPLANEFRELTGGLEFTQVQKITAWCDSQGARLPNLQKETLKALLGAGIDGEDEEDFDDGEIHSVELPAGVRRALEIRQLVGSAAVKKLPRMRACVGGDGRARGIIQYHAAQSGRFGGRLFQPHNFPTLVPMTNVGTDDEQPVDVEAVVNAIMSRDPHFVAAVLGLDAVHAAVAGLRHAITCEVDRRLVAGDFSGIEARILLAISGQRDKAELMASGADVYCDMATLIYKRPINKKNHPVERDIGKRSVLGLGYGMGWKKFLRMYAKTETEEFCQNVVRTYRKEWAPCVPNFWYGLEEASTATVWDGTPHEAYGITFALHDGWLTSRLPSGRLLWYYNPQKVKRAMPWDENDIRPGWSYNVMKTGQWKTVYAFGGQLTGQHIQAIARDLLVDAMFKCERNGMPLCMTVHDENVTEPLLNGPGEEDLRQIMVDVEPWARQIDIPIAVSIWSGDRYRK